METNPKFKFDHKKLLKQQSVEIEGQQNVRRSPVVGDNEFVEYIYDDAKTVQECFLRGLKKSENKPCFGYRPEGKDVPYEWLSYSQIWDKAQQIGSGMLHRSIKAGDLVGIFSQNNVEWGVMDKACTGYSIVSVPLYNTLGEEAIIFIINQCELSLILVDTNIKAQQLIEYQKTKQVSSLKHIVIIEDPSDKTKDSIGDTEICLLTFKDLKDEGKEHVRETVFPEVDDLYTICYTSGTSGMPKGVMISHRMIVSDLSAANAYQLNFMSKMKSSDVHFSYLPLAHIFERIFQVICHMHGASIGFFRGDAKFLLSDVAALRPTSFIMVPRIMTKFRDKIISGVNESYIKAKLFNHGLKKKMAAMKKGEFRTDTIWDKLIFNKTKALLGGRVRFCLTGAAPVSPEVLNFTRCVFGVYVIEAYGQTEGSGGFTGTLSGDLRGGNVGSIMPSCHIKLEDIEEMGYFAKDGKGEICARGPCVTKGYYKDPEKTKEAIDSDGWLHTGDVGQWLPNGSLKIIDRKKNIFKMSQGEYIAPEKIEQVFVTMGCIGQIFVHGESVKSALVAIVVPDEETIVPWCKEHGVALSANFKEHCESKKVRKQILKQMAEFGKKHGLASFEIPKRIKLSSDAFSVENDLLTPTLKSKRKMIYEKYASDLQELCDEIE